MLFIPPDPVLRDAPFAFDKLEREPLAKVLSGYVDRLRFGAVLAIDAEWGQGKTWFAQNWMQYLKKESHQVVYIDAFQADYMEDPFLLICGEISGIISAQGKKKFIENATNVALAIAPAALKAAIQGGGHVLLGISNLDKKIEETIEKALEKSEGSLGKFLEDRIKKYQENKKSISVFRESLADFASKSEKPVIVIIDELDRCKPEFAVNLIERIKHFFDVNNVVFVLFLNKKQMHNAIKGVYGQATDSHTYLEKFLNLTFTLEQPRFGKMRPFVETELAKYKIPNNVQVSEFVSGLCALIDVFNFAPRQVERAISLLSLAYPIKTAGILLAELVVLKISRPDLLDGLMLDNKSSHTELLNLLTSQARKNEQRRVSNEDLNLLIAIHQALLEDGEGTQTIYLENTYHLKTTVVRRDYSEVIKLLNIMVR